MWKILAEKIEYEKVKDARVITLHITPTALEDKVEKYAGDFELRLLELANIKYR